MLFNSLQYLVFLPFVVVLYYLIASKYRWILLLLASYFFYACWRADFLILILASTLIDYWAGLKMGRTKEKSKRKPYLILSITFNLLLLITFKYFDSAQELLASLNWSFSNAEFDLLLPIGISFYTFQTMSYSIDVYRGVRNAEKHLGVFALYVSFFPQLVAGPVERSTSLIPQFYEKHKFKLENIIAGGRLVVWGLFKKIVVADQFGQYVDMAYNSPSDYHGASWIIIALFFAVQVYLDFSGYTDIAIGSARVLGIKLSINFDRPYRATSFIEFWKRWHISLTTWFFDYLYKPLSRFTRFNWRVNIAILFILIGIWHGTGWNFVLFGLIHVVYYIVADTLSGFNIIKTNNNKVLRVSSFLKMSGVFILLTFVLVMFRAHNTWDAFYIYGEIFKTICLPFNIEELRILKTHVLLLSVGVSIFVFVQNQKEYNTRDPLSSISNRTVRWSIYYIIIFMLFVFSHQTESEFVYFQF